MINKTPREDINKIVEENQPRLKSFIRKRVQNKDDADDILQDVLYQLVKTLDNVVNPIEQATAWLYRVARNTIINKGKKMHEVELPVTNYNDDDDVLKDISEILFSEDNPTPETEYLRSLVWQELEVALSELPAEQREAFELTELEGLPVKDVAQTIGVSTNTLLSRKHYAVKHLRNRLEGLYKDLIQS